MFHVFHKNVPRGTEASRGAQDGCQVTTLEKLERHQLSEFGGLQCWRPRPEPFGRDTAKRASETRGEERAHLAAGFAAFAPADFRSVVS